MPEIQLQRSVVQYKPAGNNFLYQCEGGAGSQWCSTIKYQNQPFHMIQAHFHSPSEHQIDGQTYPLELHMVHKAEGGDSLLVLGVLFKIGNESKHIEKLLIGARDQDDQVIDFARFVDNAEGLCTYDGSLTTPPCTEGVRWLVSNTHPTVSLRQVGEYRSMVREKTNNRPIQSVADPQVVCYLNPKISTVDPNTQTPITPDGSGSSGTDASGAPGTTTTESTTTPAPGCFPGDATVRVRGGTTIPINQLRIGDEVEVTAGIYSRVYAFSHRDPHAVEDHLRITLASGTQLTLTPGHHVYLDDKLVPASNMRRGDLLTRADGTTDSVTAISTITAHGLYNPHTLSGTILVNDVLCSTYTTAVQPRAAHALLSILRAFFKIGIFDDATGGQILAHGAATIF